MKKLPTYKKLKDKEFLTIDEAVKLIGTSRSTIYRFFKRGDLPARKFGERTFIRRSDIDEFFNR